ncbi:MAG: TonB-dependent receptor [Pseudomonadota bacterium]
MSNQNRAAMRGAVLAALACATFGGQALAAAPANNSGALEEIVVTAQFREEKLQTTPIAISAFTAENMEARGIANVTDLDAFVPNTVIQPLGAGWGATLAAFIRGVGLGDNILSFEPGVPIYVDDVYMGRPQGAIFDLLDLERVEVLRGPQGTLFGKNAVGGTVRLISKKPKGDGSGSISLSIGNFNRLDARASTDLTVVQDRVFARLSFSSKKADGYFNVLDYECVNGAGSLGNGGTGGPFGSYKLGSQVAPGGSCVVDTLGDENVQSARAALRFLINDSAEFNLIGDVTSQHQKGPADKYTIMDSTNGLNTLWNGVVAGPTFGAGIGYDSRFITNSPYSNYSRYDDPFTHRSFPNINDLQHWGLSGTLEWKLTDNVNLKAVTAYRTFWNKFGRDSDGSPLPIDGTYDDNRHRQFTEELQLTGTAGKLTWATGVFYYDAHDSNRGYNYLYVPFIGSTDSLDVQDTSNWAVFGQGTWHATDKLSLTAGARYTDDQKDATIRRVSFAGVVTINDFFVPTSATNTDYTVSTNYQWTENLMTYVKYATGFKGGGFSPRPSDTLQTAPFKPEKLKTFEVGAKSELFDRRMRLNGAFFTSEYSDQQTFVQQCEPGTGPGLVVQPGTTVPCVNWFRTFNGGKSRIWGLEGELQAEPVQDLRIEASFGYVRNKVTDNQGSSLFEGSSCNGDDCLAPRTPEFSGGLGVQYSFAAAGGTLTPRLDMTYQSQIYFVTNNGCFAPNAAAGCGNGGQEALTLLNGRLTWATADRNWEVAAYGRNLTDKAYFNGKLSLVGFFGREQGNVGAPREYGLTVKKNF